jgi:dipeptidase
VEHSVNDCRVAISNEAVFSREPPGEEALLGMDLVRLGLERSETARQAVEVVTGLLETHGQGGPAVMGTTAGYHNSFLIADPSDAWILETSGKQWAARQVEGVGSISNHIAIEDDWSLRRGMRNTGRARLVAPEARISFAGAYRDTEIMPGRVSEGRFARGCVLLREGAGRLTAQEMMRFLRDHGESGTILPEQRDPESADFFTLCLHADPVGTTTASMVARLRSDGMASPTVGLPGPPAGVFAVPRGDLPAAYAQGGASPDGGSPWWRFKALQDAVLAGPRSDLVRFQSYWGAWEQELSSRAERLANEVRALQRLGESEAIRQLTSRFMERT